MKINWKNKELVESVVKDSYCYRDVLRRLGLNSMGGSNRTLRKWIDKHEIDISHFNPYKNFAETLRKRNTIPFDEILEGKHPTYPRHRLKARLFEKGIKQNICEVCGQDGMWNSKKLKMQLDHINGINDDHRLKNLRMICPNCHTQTPTFSGKHKSSGWT